MKRILLPTDFSENALHAIRYAVKLMKNSTCVFYLMHAYTPELYRVDYALGSPGQLGLPDNYQQKAETALKKLQSQIEKDFHDSRHTFVSHAALNTLKMEVKRMVKNENIDLIIMGTQGVTGAGDILFGSNTVQLFRESDVPVLAVPEAYEFDELNQILFATDYKVDYSDPILDTMLELANTWNSSLNVMHVTPATGLTAAQQSNKENLEKKLTGLDYKVHDLPDQELTDAINAFQKEWSIQLLVMMQNQHSFFERLVREPVIKTIGLHTEIPFLVLPSNPKN
ncbi:universal stress protein [Muricauda sp. JGD-17]|uniref:Universal stress protein n=1 Tax=Flagellimonas ochracea TaxID=2696472 RepID=A0A964TCQ4_9FLAO|nr:universal stress protein [Allomuricauda ochracea]NAY92420.1 universal stress protein [Allomuricauda ochracea]